MCPYPLLPSCQIATLEAGADDCLAETLDDRLILAKLNAYLRRALPRLSASLEILIGPEGDIKLDRTRREAHIKTTRGAWEAVPSLTPTEFQLLATFLARPGIVLERTFLLEAVWKEKAISLRPATVDKHLESLRRKLGPNGGRIKTVYGSGYILSGDNP